MNRVDWRHQRPASNFQSQYSSRSTGSFHSMPVQQHTCLLFGSCVPLKVPERWSSRTSMPRFSISDLREHDRAEELWDWPWARNRWSSMVALKSARMQLTYSNAAGRSFLCAPKNISSSSRCWQSVHIDLEWVRRALSQHVVTSRDSANPLCPQPGRRYRS